MTQDVEQFQNSVTFQPLMEITVGDESWDVGIGALDTGWGDSTPPYRYPLALAKDRSYGIMFDSNMLDEVGKVEDFTLYHQSPEGWNALNELSPEHFPAQLIQTLEQVANDYGCHFDASPKEVTSENSRVSHVVKVDGQRWGVGVTREEDGSAFPFAWGLNDAPQVKVIFMPESIDESRGVVEHHSLGLSVDDGWNVKYSAGAGALCQPV